MEAAAEVLVGHPVHVALDQPAHAAVAGGAAGRRAGSVEARLRVDGAAGSGAEPHAPQRRRSTGHRPERERPAPAHPPFRRRPGRRGYADAAVGLAATKRLSRRYSR